MARPSLLNLETALWVRRLGSFSATARKMNATQPAVSLRIRELESSLGTRLFERRGQRMEPTGEGLAFLQRVEPLLQGLQEAVSTLDDRIHERGILRIGSGDIPMGWTADLLRNLQRRHPQVTCELQVGIAGRLLSQLEEGKLDVVIVAGRIEHPKLESVSLGRTPMRWVVASDRWARHGDGGPPPSSITALLDCGPIWLIPRASRYFAHQAAELQATGAHLRNVSTCDNMSTLIQLVATGGGVGYLPEMLITERMERGELVPLFPEREAAAAEYALVTERGRSSPLVKKLVQLAGEHRAFAEARMKSGRDKRRARAA